MLLINAGSLKNITNFSFSDYSIISINESSENEENINLYPFSVVLPFTIIYVIVFVMGVLGNISTCIVIGKNKSMQTATNYYLFSLACSDMLLLVSGLPPEMYRIWSPDNYIFGQAFCMIQGMAAETSANATVLTITAFTVERYVAICHPFLAHAWSKPSRAIKYIIVIWIVALGLAIPQAIQFGVVDEEQNGNIVRLCTMKNPFFDHAFEISTFVIFFVPMSLISILYILIGIQLRRSTNIGSSRPKSTNTSGAQEEFGRKSNNRNTAAQKRVVKMLVAVVAAFFICWAPFHAQRLLAVYLSTASIETQEMFSDFYLYLMYVSGLLYFISTTVNPVLYHIMSKKFRTAFKDTFSQLCGCRTTSKGHYAAIRRVPPNMREIPRSVSEGLPNNTNLKSTKKHPNSKFSDSRGSSFISNASRTTSLYDRNRSIASEHGGLPDRKKYFILPLSLSKIFSRKGSEGFNNSTISNSSLKDTDVTEFTHVDLVKNMNEINDNIK
ncbi:pyrokinin-1 receptor-like [Diabrotica undecimpunctata]|uniref:pyrokinin-1 receptor-like n=1 Tax=Diabrotica undecimpunctata TaxID=50387 RepID=UPI003B638D12